MEQPPTWCGIAACTEPAFWFWPAAQYLCMTHRLAYDRGELARPSKAAIPREQLSLLEVER